MKIHLLGDIHGNITPIKEILKKDPTAQIVQVGDFSIDSQSFVYAKKNFGKNLKIVGGNHDNYSCAYKYDDSIWAGDFGFIFSKIFFIRGAESIDKHLRTEGVDWWVEEELNWIQMNHALEAYEKAKPDIMLTHTCPAFLLPIMFDIHDKPCSTSRLLDECYKIHKPKAWYFGHFHQSKQYGSFRCLGIEESVTIQI